MAFVKYYFNMLFSSMFRESGSLANYINSLWFYKG